MKEPSIDPLDVQLDAILAARPVKASKNFTRETLCRIQRAETTGALENLLEDYPVEANPDFTEKTLARLHGRSSSKSRIISFPKLIGAFAALAAAIAVAFLGTSYFGKDQAAKPLEILPPVLTSNQQIEPGNNTDVRPFVDDLFLLAAGLSEADAILEEESYAAILLLTDAM